MERGKENQEIQVSFGDVFVHKSAKGEEQRFVIVRLGEKDCGAAQLIGNQDTLPILAGAGSTNAEEIHSLIGRLTLEQVIEAYKKSPDYPESRI
jgi:hypothetical protein